MTSGAWTRLTRTRTRPTGRLALNVVLGLLLYGAGANVSSGWVVVVASLLLGTVPWALLTARRAGAGVHVRRELPDQATAGIPVRTALEVVAPTTATAVVRDHLTDTAGTAEDPRRGARLAAEVALPRGHAGHGRVEVVVTDLFGLVAVTAAGEPPGDLEVLPAVPEVHGTRQHTPWAVEAGEEASRAGAGPEILGVREYRHGDPARAVHWRASARHGQLVVREFAEESRPRVRVEVAGGQWSRAALDRATEAACGVAEDAGAGGFPVDVAVDGDVAAWGPTARRHLALVPPHAGAGPRALAAPPAGAAQVTVTLAPATEGVAVRVTADGGTADLGVLPAAASTTQTGAWLTTRGGNG